MRTVMGAGVVRSGGVSLLGTKAPKVMGTKQRNYRIPVDLVEYLGRAAKELGREQTELVVNAIRMDRDLGEKLAQHKQRMAIFAAAQGLSLERDLPEVLARLVVTALDCLEPKKPTKK